MFRNSAKFFINATEAAAFLSTTAPKALATDNSTARQKLLPTVMEIFTDLPKDVPTITQTAQLMTAIDQEASDSFAIAQHSESLRVILTSVMKANVHNVEIKEHCCRAIANVCLLPNDTFDILNGGAAAAAADSNASATAGGDEKEKAAAVPKAFADVAVELGAIEMVIGTMSHVSRLSEKGRCWTATALQNLLMFATTPSATLKAGAAGAEEVLSTFLVEMCHDASAAMADIQSEVRRAGGNTEAERVVELATTLQRMLIAMDAASVSLARLMNAPVEENANSIDTRAQIASVNVIDAAVRTMVTTLGITTVLTKINANDLRSLNFSNPMLAQARDEAALPILHKGWEVLKAIAAHKKNLPVIFNAIDEVNNDFQNMFVRNEPWLRAAAAVAPSSSAASTAAAAASANPTGHQQAVNHVLEVIVNHAMLQIAPLLASAGEASAADNVPRLAFDAALSAITDLIAPRADVTASDETSAASSSSDEASSAGSSSSPSSSHDDNDIPMAQVMDDTGYGNEAGVSRSVPTENAAVAISCIANGIAANTAVTILPSKWKALMAMSAAPTTAKASTANNAAQQLTDEEKAVLQQQYDTVRDACGYFGLLSNLADAGDAVASGPNAVAITAGALAEFLAVVQSASFKLAANKTLNASSSVAGSKMPPSQILLANLEAQHAEIVSMQRLLSPVVGKAFTLLWNAVGTPQGADAIRTVEVPATVAAINKSTSMMVQTLQARLNELVSQQLEAFEKEKETDSGATPAPEVPSAIIDGFLELERVGLQLYQKLDAIVVNPVYAQNKHDKK